VPNDQVVVIQKGKKDGEPCVITVNCPDKTELGYDLCIIILVFRFCTTKRDVSTDGKWCYVMFWVVSDPGLSNVSWKILKDRLLSICPSRCVSFYLNQQPTRSIAPSVYLLKFCCLDRKGLLHGKH
ncbi:hypothetical protein GIB67_007957, partial [Kingdonia uniflora]